MDWTDSSSAQPRAEALLQRTIDCIYEAAIDPDQWQGAIDALAAAFPDGHGSLFYQDRRHGRGTFARTSGWSPAWIDAYHAYFTERNPWLAQLKKRPLGLAASAEFMVRRDELSKTEFFNDFLKPQSLASGVGVTIAQDANRSVLVNVLYPESTDATSTANVRYLQNLVPHLKRAVQVNQRLEMQAIRSHAAEATLHRLRCGILLVSADGKVFFSNRAADAVLRQRDGLSLSREGLITVASSDARTQLYASIKSTTKPGGDEVSGGSVTVQRPSGRPAYALVVTPISQALRELTSERPCAAIFLSNFDYSPAPDRLAKTFNITPTEGKVLAGLLQGLSIPSCGASMQISPHTVRTHLRHIFEKLEVSRQADLLKFVADHPSWMVEAE